MGRGTGIFGVATALMALLAATSSGQGCRFDVAGIRGSFEVGPFGGNGGNGTAAGDLDGDGLNDLVIADATGSEIDAWLSRGGAWFARTDAHVFGQAKVAVGDFDGDGLLDAVALRTQDGDVAVFLGGGNGTLQPPVLTTLSDIGTRLVAVELNGDGRADLLVSGAFGSADFVLIGNGDGTFQPATPLALAYMSAKAADLDADGATDIVGVRVCCRVDVYLGNGDGTFQPPASYFPSNAGPELELQDFDADGTIDVAIIGGGFVTTLLGNGDGTLQPSVASPIGTSVYAAAGDLDGDLVPDVVFDDGGYQTALCVATGRGDGTFEQPSCQSAVYDTAMELSVADLDGDGDLDVVRPTNETVEVALGNGDGTFSTVSSVDLGGAVSAKDAAAGDLDRDGLVDGVVASSDGRVSVLTGNGDGTFQLGSFWTAASDAWRIEILELDGDGREDLAVLTDGGLELHLGLGDGTFLPGSTFPLSGGEDLATGDVDADGRADILVSDWLGVSVLLVGRSQLVSLPIADYGPQGVAAADLDGDGDDDIALVDSDNGSGQLSVVLSNGDGTFQAPVDYPLAPYVTQVIATDLDGDSVPDLAVATPSVPPGGVSVLKGVGDGTFGPATTFYGGILAQWLSAAEWNGDGRTDLLVTNSVSSFLRADLGSSVNLLEGDGLGGFEQLGGVHLVYYPTSISVADVDRDGAPDALVPYDPTWNGDAHLGLLRNLGVRILPRTLPDGAPSTPYAAALSGDGGTGPYDFTLASGALPPGLSLAVSGAITGTPASPGVFPFDARLTDASGCTRTLEYTIRIQPAACASMTISPDAWGEGYVGDPYALQLTASGGAAPYTFRLAGGALPPGLALSAQGLINGVPAAHGSYEALVDVVDAAGCADSRRYGIRIAICSISVLPSALPAGTYGVPYAAVFTASGGAAPYSFALTAGALPLGLALAQDGTVSGTPQDVGTFAFTVSATDGTGCSGSVSASLVIGCDISISPDTLATAAFGVPYSVAFIASGGAPPYVFMLASGSLPVGLLLSSDGILSGTPQEVGSFAFAVAATDDLGCIGSVDLLLDVGCGSIMVTPLSLPDGIRASAYASGVSATGGAAPYAFSVLSGALPPGLVLDPALGSIAGTPSARGSFSFLIGATDALGCAGSRAYDVEVEPSRDYVLGQGLGQPNPNRVRVFTAAGSATSVDFHAYAAGSFGVGVATGEIDGDALDEVLTGPGPGPIHGPQVRAFRPSGSAVAKVNFYAYGTLRFGVNATAGDVEDDSFAEILTGGGPGEVFGPHVRGFDYDGTGVSPIPAINFFAYATLRYGANAGGGDVDGDSFAEILTGPGPGPSFGPTIRGFNHDGSGLTAMGKVSFNAFALGYGADLASADADADGFAEIVATPGPGPENPARFAGFDFDATAIAALPGYDGAPFPSTFYGGSVGLGDVTGTFRWDLVAGAGRDPSATSNVLAFAYDGGSLVRLPATPFVPFPPGYGVATSAGALDY